MKLICNQAGQALFESLLSLPILISFFCLFLFGFYQLGAHYLTDHWVYQAAICLAEEKGRECKHSLNKKLELIPFSKHSIQLFYSDFTNVKIKLSTNRPLQKQQIYNVDLHLPLTSYDFQEAQ